MKLAELLTQLSAAATPGPWKADPKRLRLPVSDGSIVDGPIMGYLAGNQHAPEGMKVSLGSERIADHEFVAELVNAFRAGELRFARSETAASPEALRFFELFQMYGRHTTACEESDGGRVYKNGVMLECPCGFAQAVASLPSEEDPHV
jgi:hypothetical protein